MLDVKTLLFEASDDVIAQVSVSSYSRITDRPIGRERVQASAGLPSAEWGLYVDGRCR
jgi:hypothetical protein